MFPTGTHRAVTDSVRIGLAYIYTPMKALIPMLPVKTTSQSLIALPVLTDVPLTALAVNTYLTVDA